MEDEDKEDKNSLNIWCGNFTERVSLGAGTKTVQSRPGGLCKFLASSRLRKSGTLFEFYFYILARVFFFFGLNKSVTMKECVFSNNTPKLISH